VMIRMTTGLSWAMTVLTTLSSILWHHYGRNFELGQIWVCNCDLFGFDSTLKFKIFVHYSDLLCVLFRDGKLSENLL
jgi:hypothetical protein